MNLIPLLLILTLSNGQTLTDIFESTSFTVIANITNAFTEGPLWRNSTNTLLFSNSAANAILEWNPKGLVVTTYKSPCNSSNGLVFDSQARLIVCEQSSKRISRSIGSGTETLAHTWSGLTFNSPNDIALRSDGSIYFTDPPYFGSQFQMNFSGVFRVFPNQTVVTVATDFDRPNGIAFSVDEKTLYIDDTTRNHVRAFDVAQDGTVSNGRIFITNVPNPDGMKVDSNGNLYVTSANGLNVYKPDGTLIGVVPKPTCTSDCFPSNVAFGDSDFKGVYLTARNYLYRLQGKIAGKPTDGTLLSSTSGSESPSSSSILYSSSIQTFLLLVSALWNLLH